MMPVIVYDYGWTFCENCKAGRTHGLGYEHKTRRQMKICTACGHTTECKPKRYPLDKYDKEKS